VFNNGVDTGRYRDHVMTFHLVDDELASCVSCGLCLPHCPTYRVTGEEALSPRGRIAAMRSVVWDGAPITSDLVTQLTTCVQCRGCEPACPSGVPYGHLIESARHDLAEQHRITPRWQRMAYRVLGHHRLLLAGSTALAIGQRLRVVPRRIGVPALALRRPTPLRGQGTDAWLVVGCVMDAWQRPTHVATAQVLDAVGIAWATPTSGGCCGALHVHAGLTDQAAALATRMMRSMPGDAPVLVNSAGCGAQLKDVGRLLGTDEARAFSARVRDVHEVIAERIDRLPAPARRLGPVIVQDPCHLRHVQKVHAAVRTVLARVADVVELDDDGLCCGAGGAYAVLEPHLAGQIRDRKVAVITQAAADSGARVVASANPGCSMHLAQAGLTVRHPLDLVAEALR
jgi:glycolate oxidase iron-sulfur subunit